MIYENVISLYAPEAADDLLKASKAEDRQFQETIAKLRSLQEIDPEAFSELVDAMLYVRNEVETYSLNLMAEYGVIDNPRVIEMTERQQRIINIAKANKNIDSILDAVDYISANK